MRTGIKSKKAYDDEDWKNYVIFVHGLKSSMKSVGINKLSGMAELLEMAGKEENIDYINKNNEALLSEYSRGYRWAGGNIWMQ